MTTRMRLRHLHNAKYSEQHSNYHHHHQQLVLCYYNQDGNRYREEIAVAAAVVVLAGRAQSVWEDDLTFCERMTRLLAVRLFELVTKQLQILLMTDHSLQHIRFTVTHSVL